MNELTCGCECHDLGDPCYTCRTSRPCCQPIPPIPDFLTHLEVFSGFPVPYIVMWQNGKPDFRVVDRSKQIHCYSSSLCAICGKRQNRFFFIGGPKSIESGMFTDGPMHRWCAEFSISICPFLRGIRQSLNQRPVAVPEGEKIVTNTDVDPQRPDKMGLREAGEFQYGRYKESMVYQVTTWRGKPRWF